MQVSAQATLFLLCKFSFDAYLLFYCPTSLHIFMKGVFIQDKIKTNVGKILLDFFSMIYLYGFHLYLC